MLIREVLMMLKMSKVTYKQNLFKISAFVSYLLAL